MTLSPTLAEIEAARAIIAPHLAITPLSHAQSISEELGRSVYFKWDNKLRTGSFKERGALFFLLSMDVSARSRGVIAASAGNHALGLSFHAHKLQVPCHLVMPVNAPLVKIESCRKLGAQIVFESNLSDALTKAQELARDRGLTFIPPFDHPTIVCGQGVAGLEVLEQYPDLDSLVIPIGGGGYAAGVATAIKSQRPDVFIVGVCSEWAVAARASGGTHRQPIPPSTIADGIAVKTIGSVTGPILDTYVDSIVSVTERLIATSIIKLLEHEHMVVEGAGAAGFAGLLAGYLPDRYKKTVVMICGSNIDTNLLSRLIEHDMAERGRLLRVSISLPDRPGMLHSISGIIAANGANVLQVMHDRFYAQIPGHVDITVVMEVRDRGHGNDIVTELRKAGLPTVVA